jgi:hypothetical protein
VGARFDLETVNWLSYLLQPGRPLPRLADVGQERRSIEMFLRRLPEQFLASTESEKKVKVMAEEAWHVLRKLPGSKGVPEDFLRHLRSFLSDSPWFGLIIPSRENSDVDRFLCSRRFLHTLVHDVPWGSSGIILQPENWGVTSKPLVLLDVFPAFRTALREATRWPGMLFWTPGGEAIFLTFPSRTQKMIKEGAAWVLSNIRVTRGTPLRKLQETYYKRYPAASPENEPTTTLLHISDLHIGSMEAVERITRLRRLLMDLVAESPKGSRVIPVLTGDVIDSPNDEYYHSAREFIDFLHDIGTQHPAIVLGNHDVRKNGYLSENLRMAIRIPADHQVRWDDDQGIGIVCFNSVVGGKLATGKIGGDQFVDIGNAIDRKLNWRYYTLVGALHHHPIPVERPSWYARPFYERIFGRFFEKTDELEDAPRFRQFAKHRAFAAVLHGHKHIPRIGKLGEIGIFGCGSSVGKVPTNNDQIYLSVNLVDINRHRRQLSCRLMVEHTPGGGLLPHEETHEMLHQQAL